MVIEDNKNSDDPELIRDAALKGCGFITSQILTKQIRQFTRNPFMKNVIVNNFDVFLMCIDYIEKFSPR